MIQATELHNVVLASPKNVVLGRGMFSNCYQTRTHEYVKLLFTWIILCLSVL